VEPRRRARAFVLGLLAELPRKNCWTIAEHAGDPTPDGMQHLLARAKWDAGGVRDDVRSYVTRHLGDRDAVLVVDETGDLKKGTATAGVQRQYTGTAGRIENSQVAVYLGYAAPRGHALIDRELYLPRSWTGDPQRCAAAGIPEDLAFATKPELARRMIGRAVTAHILFAWVSGDEVYGDNGALRAWLEGQHLAYVLAVACDHRVPAGAGRADRLAARLPRRAWQQLSAGQGVKGHRYYDWAWAAVPSDGPGCRHLLIRRNRRTGELASCRCFSPRPVTLAALVKVARLRWTIEENFQASKGLTGLDEHQARRWTSWYRWVTLAMLAAAVLTIAAAESAPSPAPDTLIPLTRNEIAHCSHP
jgi:SRSO17 transposase